MTAVVDVVVLVGVVLRAVSVVRVVTETDTNRIAVALLCFLTLLHGVLKWLHDLLAWKYVILWHFSDSRHVC